MRVAWARARSAFLSSLMAQGKSSRTSATTPSASNGVTGGPSAARAVLSERTRVRTVKPRNRRIILLSSRIRVGTSSVMVRREARAYQRTSSRSLSAGNMNRRRRWPRDRSHRLKPLSLSLMIMSIAGTRPRKDAGHPMRSRCRPTSKEPIGRPKSLAGRGLDVFFLPKRGTTCVLVRGGGATTCGEDHELSWDGRERTGHIQAVSESLRVPSFERTPVASSIRLDNQFILTCIDFSLFRRTRLPPRRSWSERVAGPWPWRGNRAGAREVGAAPWEALSGQVERS